MSFNVIQHMLSNRRYIGELKYRDILIPDAIPPIVSVELFNDVQEKMLKNKKAPARRKAEDDYLLTTKLFCGYCGALMFGESGTSRTGEVHRYYKCATAKKHKGCKKKTVRKQWLEDLVVNQTMQLVKDDAAMESIIAKVMELQNKENTNIPLYEKQLRDAESGIQNMLNAIQAGILTSSTKERLEQLEETKRELEARIAEEKLAKPKVTEEFIRFWLLRFRKLDMSLKDQRQALVDTFINSIYLYDDKVLITFNYKEGTQTITFEEAAEAASKGNGSDLDCFTAPQERQLLIAVFFVLYGNFSLTATADKKDLNSNKPPRGGGRGKKPPARAPKPQKQNSSSPAAHATPPPHRPPRPGAPGGGGGGGRLMWGGRPAPEWRCGPAARAGWPSMSSMYSAAQGLLLCLFGLGQAGGLALFASSLMRAIFSCDGGPPVFSSGICYNKKTNPLSHCCNASSPEGRGDVLMEFSQSV